MVQKHYEHWITFPVAYVELHPTHHCISHFPWRRCKYSFIFNFLCCLSFHQQFLPEMLTWTRFFLDWTQMRWMALWRKVILLLMTKVESLIQAIFEIVCRDACFESEEFHIRVVHCNVNENGLSWLRFRARSVSHSLTSARPHVSEHTLFFFL